MIRSRLADRSCCPRGGEEKFEARCPAHDDARASLSVSVGKDGRVLIHCHAGCAAEDVLAALDLAWRDLYPDDGRNNERREIVSTYDYTDEGGELLFQVVRFSPKGFAQRRPDGNGGWAWKLDRTRRVLYRLPQVIEAVERGERIYVVEGEKDVHALERAGVTATTNPGGALKWRDSYSVALTGASVVIVADRDVAGRRHAQEVARSLAERKCAVRIVEAAKGKDAADHLAAGLGVGDFAGTDSRPESPERVIVAESFARIRAERTRWLWEGRIALGAPTLLVGREKLGKSTLTNELAARLSRGRTVRRPRWQACGHAHGLLRGQRGRHDQAASPGRWR